MTLGVEKGHLKGEDRTSRARTHSQRLPEGEQFTSVGREQGGKEGARQTDRERKLSWRTTQIKECALFFFPFKEPEEGNSTFGIKACVSLICHGCLRQ